VDKKRIVILGSSGFIGGYLLDYLRLLGNDVTGTYHLNPRADLIRLDLMSFENTIDFLREKKPELVLFLSGTKDIGRCEKDPDYALNANVQVVRNYIRACGLLKIEPKTVFFSTDYVFDGLKGGYGSADPVGPRTVYGITNVIAERLFIASKLPTIILRVSAVMGSRGGFYSWLTASLEAGEKVHLYDNTFFSPTSIGRLCEYIAKVTSQSFENKVTITHLSDGYRLTRFQFGILLSNRIGKARDLVVAKSADVDGFGFQSDLSLLPDGQPIFTDLKLWDEMGRIY